MRRAEPQHIKSSNYFIFFSTVDTYEKIYMFSDINNSNFLFLILFICKRVPDVIWALLSRQMAEWQPVSKLPFLVSNGQYFAPSVGCQLETCQKAGVTPHQCDGFYCWKPFHSLAFRFKIINELHMQLRVWRCSPLVIKIFELADACSICTLKLPYSVKVQILTSDTLISNQYNAVERTLHLLMLQPTTVPSILSLPVSLLRLLTAHLTALAVYK